MRPTSRSCCGDGTSFRWTRDQRAGLLSSPGPCAQDPAAAQTSGRAVPSSSPRLHGFPRLVLGRPAWRSWGTGTAAVKHVRRVSGSLGLLRYVSIPEHRRLSLFQAPDILRGLEFQWPETLILSVLGFLNFFFVSSKESFFMTDVLCKYCHSNCSPDQTKKIIFNDLNSRGFINILLLNK